MLVVGDIAEGVEAEDKWERSGFGCGCYGIGRCCGHCSISLVRVWAIRAGLCGFSVHG